SNGIVEILLSGDLGRPNGLLYEKDRLLMLTNQTHLLESINVETKERTVLADSLGHADGIEHIGNGAYLVSNWQGEIYHLSSSMIPSKILDTKDEKINAADIDYIASNRLLLIPTFFDNRVRAYRLVE
ncbi:MAG: gluconolaconase, partial [Cyclobacteriaceae bacterium]|nr:gluconolaconase [Cyclobacteriaceae bacterium]